MLWTTVPAILITLTVFLLIGLTDNSTIVIDEIINLQNQLDQNFNINPIMLCTISGQYDLMAKVTEETTQTLDMVIDKIAALEGVKQTLSHIVLSQKKNRTI